MRVSSFSIHIRNIPIADIHKQNYKNFGLLGCFNEDTRYFIRLSPELFWKSIIKLRHNVFFKYIIN